jgi:hypothetical protein
MLVLPGLDRPSANFRNDYDFAHLVMPVLLHSDYLYNQCQRVANLRLFGSSCLLRDRSRSLSCWNRGAHRSPQLQTGDSETHRILRSMRHTEWSCHPTLTLASVRIVNEPGRIKFRSSGKPCNLAEHALASVKQPGERWVSAHWFLSLLSASKLPSEQADWARSDPHSV